MDEQLFREIVEEEKLDEQAAIKEEIEADEDEKAGIVPKSMLMSTAARLRQKEFENNESVEDEGDSDDEVYS